MSKNKSDSNMKLNKEIISIIISMVAVLVSIISLIYTTGYNKKYNNLESYFKPLSYSIEFMDEGYTPEITVEEPDMVWITSPSFSVIPETGGIKSASLVYYYNGDCLASLELRMTKDIDHEKYEASDLEHRIREFSEFAYEELECSLKYSVKGCKLSYYTTIYVVVEDYNNSINITPIVFEYPIGEDGKSIGEYDHREYSKLDLIFKYNEHNNQLPNYDLEMLSDYESIYEKINRIG